MLSKFQNTLLLLGALMMWVAMPAIAQSVPDWMIGRFEGTRNDGVNITLNVDNQGRLSATGRESGRSSDRLAATFRRGILTIDGLDYRVDRASNGFRALPVDDLNGAGTNRSPRMDFRRIDDRLDNGVDDRVPDWMVGTFEGSSRSTRQIIMLTFTRQGEMSIASSGSGNNFVRGLSAYRRGILTMYGRGYRPERTDSGFRAIPISGSSNDSNQQFNFQRVSDRNGNGASRLPDWMAGSFEGYNRRDRQTIMLRSDSRGYLTATTRSSGLNSGRTSASYRRGILTIDGRDYRTERDGDGFRATSVDDSRDAGANRSVQIDFRRTDTSADTRIPDWMIGNFDGFNRRDRRIMTLRADTRGDLRAVRLDSAQDNGRTTASYRRGVLTMDGSDYTVERITDGFRATRIDNNRNQTNDRNSDLTFRRTNY